MQFQTFQGAILTQNLEKSQKDVTFIGIWGVRGGPLGTHFRYLWVPFFDDFLGSLWIPFRIDFGTMLASMLELFLEIFPNLQI